MTTTAANYRHQLHETITAACRAAIPGSPYIEKCVQSLCKLRGMIDLVVDTDQTLKEIFSTPASRQLEPAVAEYWASSPEWPSEGFWNGNRPFDNPGHAMLATFLG